MAARATKINWNLIQPIGPARRSINDFCHDVRNSLSVIKEYASIITDGLGGQVTQQQKEYLETIIKAVNEAASMVDKLSKRHADPKE